MTRMIRSAGNEEVEELFRIALENDSSTIRDSWMDYYVTADPKRKWVVIESVFAPPIYGSHEKEEKRITVYLIAKGADDQIEAKVFDIERDMIKTYRSLGNDRYNASRLEELFSKRDFGRYGISLGDVTEIRSALGLHQLAHKNRSLC